MNDETPAYTATLDADQGARAHALTTAVTALQADLREAETHYALMRAERDAERARGDALERTLAVMEAHLDREARSANHFHEMLEKDRREGDAMRSMVGNFPSGS